jgi:putative flippase GtrA
MLKQVKQLIKSKKQIRYLISGSLGFTFEYLIFLILYFFSQALIISNSISFICALIITFSLHRKWSFRGEYELNSKKQFYRYSALATFNFFLTNVLIEYLVHHLKIPAYVAKLMVMLTIVALNYLIINNVVFHHQRS